MNKLGDAEIISGAALGALGVMIVMQASRWDYYTSNGPGAGFFPTFYGVGLIALSLLHIISRLRASGELTMREPDPENIDAPVGGLPGWVKALTCWAVFAGTMLSMEWLGFALGLALLTLYLVLVIFRKSVVTAVVTAVGMSAGFYAVFSYLLEVNLPTGVVGF